MRSGKKALRKLDEILGRRRPPTEIQHDNINGHSSACGSCGPEPGSVDEVNSMASGPLELQTPEQMESGESNRVQGQDPMGGRRCDQRRKQRNAEQMLEEQLRKEQFQFQGQGPTPEQMGEQQLMEEQIASTFGGLGVGKVVFAGNDTRITIGEDGEQRIEGAHGVIDCRSHERQELDRLIRGRGNSELPDDIHEYNRSAPPQGGG